MIEKLKEHDVIDPKTGNVIGKIGCDLREIMDKLNEVIDAANKHEDIIRQIGEWGSSKDECLWCENLTEVNLYDNSEKANCQENVQKEALDKITALE